MADADGIASVVNDAASGGHDLSISYLEARALRGSGTRHPTSLLLETALVGHRDRTKPDL